MFLGFLAAGATERSSDSDASFSSLKGVLGFTDEKSPSAFCHFSKYCLISVLKDKKMGQQTRSTRLQSRFEDAKAACDAERTTVTLGTRETKACEQFSGLDSGLDFLRVVAVLLTGLLKATDLSLRPDGLESDSLSLSLLVVLGLRWLILMDANSPGGVCAQGEISLICLIDTRHSKDAHLYHIFHKYHVIRVARVIGARIPSNVEPITFQKNDGR